VCILGVRLVYIVAEKAGFELPQSYEGVRISFKSGLREANFVSLQTKSGVVFLLTSRVSPKERAS